MKHYILRNSLLIFLLLGVAFFGDRIWEHMSVFAQEEDFVLKEEKASFPYEFQIEDEGKWVNHNVAITVVRLDGTKVTNWDEEVGELWYSYAPYEKWERLKQDSLEITCKEGESKKEKVRFQYREYGESVPFQKEFEIKIDKKAPATPKIVLKGEEKENKTAYTSWPISGFLLEEENEEESNSSIFYSINNGETLEYSRATEEFVEREDGTYEVVAYARDEAGNISKQPIIKKFILDSKSPIIMLQGIETGQTYTTPVLLKMQINEENVSTYATILKTVNHEATEYQLKDFVKKDGALQNEYFFKEEGEYEFSLYAVDQAGNQSVVEYRKFTVDLEAPTLCVSGIKENEIYKEPKVLQVSMKDSIEDNLWGECRIKCMSGDKKVENRIIKLSKEKSEKILLEKEGIYEIYSTVSDGCHDTVTKKQTITIDLNKPMIDKPSWLKKQYESFMLPVPKSMMATDFTGCEVKVYLDGVSFEEGEVCKEIGEHTLYIEATDAAGNQSNRQERFEIINHMTQKKEQESIAHNTTIWKENQIETKQINREIQKNQKILKKNKGHFLSVFSVLIIIFILFGMIIAITFYFISCKKGKEKI